MVRRVSATSKKWLYKTCIQWPLVILARSLPIIEVNLWVSTSFFDRQHQTASQPATAAYGLNWKVKGILSAEIIILLLLLLIMVFLWVSHSVWVITLHLKWPAFVCFHFGFEKLFRTIYKSIYIQIERDKDQRDYRVYIVFILQKHTK